MKVFGFAIVLISLLALAPGPQSSAGANIPAGHALMGFIFGICHLAYGAYLYLTEKGKNAA
jgi:hypothetical protein